MEATHYIAAAQLRPEAESAPVDGILLDTRKKKKVFNSPFIRKLQRRHYLLFDVLPFGGAALAVAVALFIPIGWTELALFGLMWALTGLGITVGYHRLFTHRTFKARPWVRSMLQIWGCMAAQGPAVSWACLHRRHHELSDQDGDPHSPNLHGHATLGQRLRGLLHSHMTWMRAHDYPSVAHYAPDLIRDKLANRIDQYYFYWIALGCLIPTVIGGLVHMSWQGALNGLLWGGFLRIFVVEHKIWAINSLLHTMGRRAFNTSEQSRNSALFSVLTMGESWHNNHHAFPGSAHFGLAWYRPDPGFWFIRTLERAGLASDVHVPSQARIRNFDRQR